MASSDELANDVANEAKARPAGFELPLELMGAARYAVAALIHERRLSNRGVPAGVLALHRQLMSANGVSDNGRSASQTACATGQLGTGDDLIGTAATAALLGRSERQVRRLETELGGLRPDGRHLVFSRRSVVAYARTHRKEPPQ